MSTRLVLTQYPRPQLRVPSRRLISDRHSSLPCLYTVQKDRRLSCHSTSRVKALLKVSPEVAHAVAANEPVVALESTIYTHGALGNDLLLEDVVRRHGAVPAVCGILAGVPTVGLTPAEVECMVNEGARKASRRDLAYVVGTGAAGQRVHAGTTIAGTIVLARLAGIRVFGTGGLGGVHRGGQDSLDVSADLTELGRTRMAVISSGCKGFLDIPRTLEFLETQGAMISTFADGREGEVDFPAFWARDSGSKSPFTVRDEKQAAAISLAQEQLGIESGMLFANPIPEEHAIPRAELEAAIALAVSEASENGVSGHRNTPYILQRIRELTQGQSVLANKHLVRANVARAAKVAVELSKLLGGATSQSRETHTVQVPYDTSLRGGPVKKPEAHSHSHLADILVAGSVALDLSCDYTGGPDISPTLHTSNSASINQTVGGVGHNVALAAHKVSEEGKVRLCSMVGDDIAGSTILSSLEASGLDPCYIRQLGHEYPARTAQYVAVNDADKSLVLAMADMSIFTRYSFPEYWSSAVAATRPKWLVVDGNWSETDLRTWINAGREYGAQVAFEPVSVAKSQRLFAAPTKNPHHGHGIGIYPDASITLATPNQHELKAMYEAAKTGGYFDSPGWFEIIDAFGMRGARDRFVRLTSVAMTDKGIPVQTVNLLPYIPTIITKLGSDGALLTAVLGRDDARLKDPKEAPYILTRSNNNHPQVGGVYMRLFPAAEKVQNIVSVNGVGDTFLGVLVAGLAQGGKVVNLVDIAQKAAVMSLKSRESVNDELVGLKAELRAAVVATS